MYKMSQLNYAMFLFRELDDKTGTSEIEVNTYHHTWQSNA